MTASNTSPGYGDGAHSTKPSILREQFASIDNGTHTINGVDDVTKLIEQLTLTVPNREDLQAIIQDVAEDDTEINFIQFSTHCRDQSGHAARRGRRQHTDFGGCGWQSRCIHSCAGRSPRG